MRKLTKDLKFVCFCIVGVLNFANSYSQSPYPFGMVRDSVIINDIQTLPSMFRNKTFVYYVYKPLTYDSTQSEMVFAIHGTGGWGGGTINNMINIANRRNAMIIGVNMDSAGCFRDHESVCVYIDSLDFCVLLRPSQFIFKELYKHILQREQRVEIPSRMVGFSSGAQFVTRYLLFRQTYTDSIPFRMFVSADPYYYSFPIDTFNGIAMDWMCGLLFSPHIGDCPSTDSIYKFDCNDYIVQYYNENYGVLIGTFDTQPLFDSPCGMIQGNNRYERAQTFYAFCDSNAVNRGTALQWEYAEVPNVGHDEYGLYNTKALPTDSSSILETLLFDTPYHTVPSIGPIADFYSVNTVVSTNTQVQFVNTSINAVSYKWYFGDGTTSTLQNPTHTYSSVDTFTVQLSAIGSSGCDAWTERRHYIKVNNTIGIPEIHSSVLNAVLSPNPAKNDLSIGLGKICNNINFRIFTLQGQLLLTQHWKVGNSFTIALPPLSKGLYLVEIICDEGVVVKKVMVE